VAAEISGGGNPSPIYRVGDLVREHLVIWAMRDWFVGPYRIGVVAWGPTVGSQGVCSLPVHREHMLIINIQYIYKHYSSPRVIVTQ
jgi:hypothetical protein